MSQSLEELLLQVRGCKHCPLPHSPRPVVTATRNSRILIVGQAPGRVVHETGIPFNDRSGDRLRDWLGVDRDTFYDADQFAIVPMGFCFPGTGKSGDLPPRKECAPLWHHQLMPLLESVQLSIFVGRFAIDNYLPQWRRAPLQDAVGAWRELLPSQIALPHPSPRNIAWFQRHPWFEEQLLSPLRQQVALSLIP